MKIALIYPPFLSLFGGNTNEAILGLCLLGTLAIQNGHSVVVYSGDYSEQSKNFSLLDYQRNHQNYIANLNDFEYESWKKIKLFLKEFSPELIGITCMTAHLASVLRLSQLCKADLPSCHIVVGGHHPTVVPEQLINSPYMSLSDKYFLKHLCLR